MSVAAFFKIPLDWQKVAVLLVVLFMLVLFGSCSTGRWVQAGKTEEDIQRDLKDCEDYISQEKGVDLMPEQYTSTRYYEREPPLKSSQEDVVARAMRQCMEEKGYQLQRD
jgi:hypothetical protein